MTDTVSVFLRAVMLALAALLPFINPPGVAPIFLSMTPGASDPTRAALSRRIAWYSFVLLMAAMLVGSYVMMFFGLSLAVVKIAGGLLVTTTAWHLLNRSEPSGDSAIAAQTQAMSADQLASHSFYPLTFPLTIGPGSISVAVTLGAGVRAHNSAEVVGFMGTMAGIAIVSAAVYFCCRFASRLLRVLGGTGTVVLLRLSAFLLMAVGVQITCDGFSEQFGLAGRVGK